jgi:hypothetical protein
MNGGGFVRNSDPNGVGHWTLAFDAGTWQVSDPNNQLANTINGRQIDFDLTSFTGIARLMCLGSTRRAGRWREAFVRRSSVGRADAGPRIAADPARGDGFR